MLNFLHLIVQKVFSITTAVTVVLATIEITIYINILLLIQHFFYSHSLHGDPPLNGIIKNVCSC